MRKLAICCLAVGGILWGTMPVQAFGHRHRGDCCEAPCGPAMGCGACAAPCAPPVVTWVEKQVTCYRPEMRQREVPCTFTQMVPRTIVENRPCTVMVPHWVEEVRHCTVMTVVPRPVTREVTCCRMVPTCVTDPCTGCTRTVCRPEMYTKQVTCTVMECVPVQKECRVRVCHPHPEQRTVQVCRVVCEPRQVTVVRRECYCVMVPYQTTVKVPVCTPAPAPAPCPVVTNCCYSAPACGFCGGCGGCGGGCGGHHHHGHRGGCCY